MRFIHCADIHLDSPFVGLAARPDAPRDTLRDATRRAFSALVDHALREQVDFVVIAGDLYDGKWKDYTTGLFFVAEMGRLARAGIPAFVLHGNHDAESQLTKRLTLPDNVRVFGARKPETFTLDGLDVALHGQSFATRAVTDNLAADYPQPVPGAFNIGVLHTAMEGAAEHAPYAPCRLAELTARGYDYWALGHVHARAVLSRHPHVVFPGNLQGRSIRETGPKGFDVVTVTDGRVADVRPIAVDTVRWARIEVDIAGAKDFEAALALVRPEIGAAIDAADGRVPALRLILRGRTPAHDTLKAEPELLHSECLAVALSASDAVWIEKVVTDTTPPEMPEHSAANGDAVGALFATIDGLIADNDALTDLRVSLADLVGRLPADLRRTMLTEQGALDPSLLSEVLDEARALIGRQVHDGEAAQ